MTTVSSSSSAARRGSLEGRDSGPWGELVHPGLPVEPALVHLPAALHVSSWAPIWAPSAFLSLLVPPDHQDDSLPMAEGRKNRRYVGHKTWRAEGRCGPQVLTPPSGQTSMPLLTSQMLLLTSTWNKAAPFKSQSQAKIYLIKVTDYQQKGQWC